MCRHFSSGANRDRTGDLLLAKSARERVAVGRLRVSAGGGGLRHPVLRVSVGRIRAAEASVKLPERTRACRSFAVAAAFAGSGSDQAGSTPLLLIALDHRQQSRSAHARSGATQKRCTGRTSAKVSGLRVASTARIRQGGRVGLSSRCWQWFALRSRRTRRRSPGSHRERNGCETRAAGPRRSGERCDPGGGLGRRIQGPDPRQPAGHPLPRSGHRWIGAWDARVRQARHDAGGGTAAAPV
jgi:hypothetical protein